MRNENIYIIRIDNNALREALVRLGASITALDGPQAGMGYYAAEFGRSPAEFPYLKPRALSGWHGELYEIHQNSVFNARTFFQAGPVKPSHQNSYGFLVGKPLWKNQALSIDGSQRKIRGMVNGNVLVPAPEEREPRTPDPAARTIINRFLNAFPVEPPNRTDFNLQALNTNAPQMINEDRLGTRWDSKLRRGRQLWTKYQYNNKFVDAFQFVAGQNPDTTLRSQHAQITLAQTFGGLGVWTAGLAFQRMKSLLSPEPNAVGPYVRFARSIESLGPANNLPIDRVENSFRVGNQFVWRHRNHGFTAGAELARLQLNGRETLNHRGYFAFNQNFGRSAVENLLYGTPTFYKVGMGDPSRGFRNVVFQAYFGDAWRLSARWQLNASLLYGLETAPHEISNRTPVPYHCNCTNFSPRFGFAIDEGMWGVFRGGYILSVGQIIPATYQQARFNPPGIVLIEVQNPSLTQPLQGIDLNGLATARSGLFLLDSNLRDPYSHQYTFSWEKQFHRDWTLRLGYVGSRSFQLFIPLIANRAQPVPGIPLTTATIDVRRPDSRHYEVTRIVNMGSAYLDAAQVSLLRAWRKGLLLSVTYTFGKALDTGADYTSTGSGDDIISEAAQSEFESQKDMKGPSRFDSTHTLLFHMSYELPLKVGSSWGRALLTGWHVSGATLFRSGMPFSVSTGSDSPGFGNVDGKISDRPNVVDLSILGRTIDHPDRSRRGLPPSAFEFIRLGEQRGNLGRNTFRKDGIGNVNMAVTKEWRLPSNSFERKLLFRVEAINALNHSQFDAPGRSLANRDFGAITNTLNDGRVLELSLRLLF